VHDPYSTEAGVFPGGRALYFNRNKVRLGNFAHTTNEAPRSRVLNSTEIFAGLAILNLGCPREYVLRQINQTADESDVAETLLSINILTHLGQSLTSHTSTYSTLQ
jgi:hypothetical protein